MGQRLMDILKMTRDDCQAGSDLAEIATITGHSLRTVAEIIEHYLERTGKMARSASIRRLDAAEERLAAAGGHRPGTFAADT